MAKQIISKNYHDVAFAELTQFMDILGGSGAPVFGASGSPVPENCTFNNLVGIIPAASFVQACTITIQKNTGSGWTDTALVITIGSGGAIVKDTTHTISFLQGNLVRGKVTVADFQPGFPLSLSVEINATANMYGSGAFGGSVSINDGFYGGSFSNAGYEAYGGNPTIKSNTYSISALDGNLTRLVTYAISGAPGTGVWTSNIILNGVIQDGSGGTVNTTSVITGTDVINIKTFTLPVVIGDIVQTLTVRTGASAGFAVHHVCNSVSFAPTVSGAYMLNGGDNSSIRTDITGWRWNSSLQEGAPEVVDCGIVGPAGLQATGIYYELTHAPTVGKSWDLTVRKSQTNTALVVSIADNATTGLVNANVLYSEDALIVIQLQPNNNPQSSQLHWGLAANTISPGTILVTKVVSPSSNTTEFDFTAGGGLSPSSFSLSNGETQEFAGLSPGTYSVEEDPVEGFTTEVTVSNGDPNTAIDLGSGDVITVTFTNTLPPEGGSGIYKVVPGKRQDTLWVDGGSGTTIDVKIP